MRKNRDVIDLNPKLADFRKEVLKSLLESPKKISPKFFYDENGSRLFEEITNLKEYYPTRSEMEILEKRCSEISEFIGPGALVIELGGGNGMKGSRLLKCLVEPDSYVLVDISHDSLTSAVERLTDEYPEVDVKAVWADYTDPKVMGNLDFPGRKALVFLGSTIGNMEPEDALSFLSGCRSILSDGETMTIGVDLKKEIGKLELAYNDSRGITAEFNLNLINRINRVFATSIDRSTFKHVAFYNSEKGRIEMHLQSLDDQAFSLDGNRIFFHVGETIHTENSYKYSITEFTALLLSSGFSSVTNWVDSQKNYALFAARA